MSNRYQFATLSSKSKFLGVVMSLGELALVQEVALTAKSPAETGYDRLGFIKTRYPEVQVIEGEGKETVIIDIANDEVMAKFSDLNSDFGGFFGITNIELFTDRLRNMDRTKSKASTVAANEMVFHGKFKPFRNAAPSAPHDDGLRIFKEMNAHLGPKIQFGVYAYDMPGFKEPVMFYVGSKQARLKGHLNMAQWRDVTDEEGLKLFNTLRTPLASIGRTAMVKS
ncbi:hypothetical protein D6_0180 [Aeromonas phage D6]|uniref:Uncharacterized protein n=1 Tax=Aeromonas phage D6 TaxID=2593322 RepID=A0A514TWC8_9CAUD|nr:hypothetical protein PQC08_gp095 [Aeromonas phage D6]QDJ97339.1 hypothetical protein D6_0180 [Aeromonas phage D6]